ncbi:unnamed protein product [Phytophthora fragariaefolia]|uniref:Unnamed protein product n=1 Tax=Phytophthora fragariaefolia TaxID=1490495 RepID=A0A9W6XNK9_9STRA|nr:unnamed protein product [Phytophthora fragariaefolia]
MGYKDGVKEYRVLNVATGNVQIVRTVKFTETTDPDQLMIRLEMDGDEEAGASERQPKFLPPLVPASNALSIVEARRQDVTNHDMTPNGASITLYADHLMITPHVLLIWMRQLIQKMGARVKSKWWYHRRFGPSVKRLIKPVPRLMMSSLPLKAEC